MVSFLKETNTTKEKIEEKPVMKMEIRYKEVTDEDEQQALNNLKEVIDQLFVRFGISNKEGNFYIGNNDAHDYARFGMVFEALSDWRVFLKCVEVWNFYNEHGVVENFGIVCKKKVGV